MTTMKLMIKYTNNYLRDGLRLSTSYSLNKTMSTCAKQVSLELQRNELKSKALLLFKFGEWTILKKRRGEKGGVYALVNNLTGRFYIGSSVGIYGRLRDYTQPAYLEDKKTLTIVKALNKYGHENFTILILEFEEEDPIRREQKWMDHYKPVYNILKKAGNSRGYIHTDERKDKIRRRKLGTKQSPELVTAKREWSRGNGNPFYSKTHSQESKNKIIRTGINNGTFKLKQVTLHNVQTNEILYFESLHDAARKMKCIRQTLKKYSNTDKLFRKVYLVKVEE